MSRNPSTAAWPEFLELWSTAMRSVLGQISGADFHSTVTCDAVEQIPLLASEDSTDCWFVVAIGSFAPGGSSAKAGSFAGGRGFAGHAALRFERSSALAMAKILMAELDESPGGFTAEHEDAIAELIRMFCGSLAVILKAGRDEEVPVRLVAVAQPSWGPARCGSVELATEDGTKLQMRFFADEALASAVEASNLSRRGNPTKAEPASAANQLEAEPKNLNGTQDISSRLSVLRDLRLKARLSFGDHTMLLSDVLGCVPGSVIESDRQMEMPVELWVEGILAARGDIVIVDGSYGVCIRELCHSESRRTSVSRGTLLAD
jgi:flagellar motor switch/type III secretory pathway protein FliN